MFSCGSQHRIIDAPGYIITGNEIIYMVSPCIAAGIALGTAHLGISLCIWGCNLLLEPAHSDILPRHHAKRLVHPHGSASFGNSSFSEPREIRNPASTISTIATPGGVNQFHAPRPSAWLA